MNNIVIVHGFMQSRYICQEKKEGNHFALPWFSRAFSGEKGEWYLAAGERSGLLENDELRVIVK